MILNVSGRCDIVAFYSEWFINRYKEGYVCVRNPFNPKLVSKISFDNVDLILFCTKNPEPILKNINIVEQPIIFHVTLTPYNKDIEPNLPPKGNIIKSIKKLSKIIGIDNLYIRYDPIFISDKYNIEYHIKTFKHLCELLTGYVNKIIVSFLDEYKNVKKNYHILKYKELTSEDYKTIGLNFSKIAKDYNMTVQTCFEKHNLVEYGFIKGECLSKELAYKLTNKIYPKWKARKEGLCKCVQMVDIGVYNSCPHFCKYCYANYDEKQVKKNKQSHNPNSSLLIGTISHDDIIKERL